MSVSGRDRWRTVQEWRNEKLPLTTTSDEACKMYDALITQLLGWYDEENFGGTVGTIKRMTEADPNFVMGLVLDLSGNSGLSNFESPVVPAKVQKLKTLRDEQRKTLTQRENRHVDAVLALYDGKIHQAIDILTDILIDHPTDVHAFKFVQDLCFFTGKAEEMRDISARVYRSFTPDKPLKNYMHSLYAFGLCETNLLDEAEYQAKLVSWLENIAWEVE